MRWRKTVSFVVARDSDLQKADRYTGAMSRKYMFEEFVANYFLVPEKLENWDPRRKGQFPWPF
jgi:hypothetical protein